MLRGDDFHIFLINALSLPLPCDFFHLTILSFHLFVTRYQRRLKIIVLSVAVKHEEKCTLNFLQLHDRNVGVN
jgi:hypothetical protein